MKQIATKILTKYKNENYYSRPATEGEIREIEKQLEVSLPESYKWFLRNYGGIYEAEGITKDGHLTVVEETLSYREEGLDKHFVFLDWCDEYGHFLDLSRGDKDDCYVVNWSHFDSDGAVFTNESFFDYLVERLGDGLVNFYEEDTGKKFNDTEIENALIDISLRYKKIKVIIENQKQLDLLRNSRLLRDKKEESIFKNIIKYLVGKKSIYYMDILVEGFHDETKNEELTEYLIYSLENYMNTFNSEIYIKELLTSTPAMLPHAKGWCKKLHSRVLGNKEFKEVYDQLFGELSSEQQQLITRLMDED